MLALVGVVHDGPGRFMENKMRVDEVGQLYFLTFS